MNKACPHCGGIIEDTDSFCMHCGNAVLPGQSSDAALTGQSSDAVGYGAPVSVINGQASAGVGVANEIDYAPTEVWSAPLVPPADEVPDVDPFGAPQSEDAAWSGLQATQVTDSGSAGEAPGSNDAGDAGAFADSGVGVGAALAGEAASAGGGSGNLVASAAEVSGGLAASAAEVSGDNSVAEQPQQDASASEVDLLGSQPTVVVDRAEKESVLEQEDEQDVELEPDEEDSSPTIIVPRERSVLVRVSTGDRFVLEYPCMIGRSSTADVRIRGNQAVSRKHARLAYEDGEFRVYDLASTNSTYVDGVAVSEGGMQAISGGSMLRLGTEDFEFVLEDV